jgi:hypothetical protein
VHRRHIADSKTSTPQNRSLSSQITSQVDPDPALFLVSTETSQALGPKTTNYSPSQRLVTRDPAMKT